MWHRKSYKFICVIVQELSHHKKWLLKHLKICLDIAIDKNEILDIVVGDDSDVDIDLGYENNLFNKVSDSDDETEPAATVRNVTGTVVVEQQFGADEIVSEIH